MKVLRRKGREQNKETGELTEEKKNEDKPNPEENQPATGEEKEKTEPCSGEGSRR